MSSMCNIFNKRHSVVNLNNVKKSKSFEEVLWESKPALQTYGQKDKPMHTLLHKHFSTLLESIKKENKLIFNNEIFILFQLVFDEYYSKRLAKQISCFSYSDQAL